MKLSEYIEKNFHNNVAQLGKHSYHSIIGLAGCYILLAPNGVGKSTWIYRNILKLSSRLSYQKIWRFDFKKINDYNFLNHCHEFKSTYFENRRDLIILDHIAEVEKWNQPFYLDLFNDFKQLKENANIDFVFALEEEEIGLFQRLFNKGELKPYLIDLKEPNRDQIINYLEQEIGSFNPVLLDIETFLGKNRRWQKAVWLLQYINSNNKHRYWSNNHLIEHLGNQNCSNLFLNQLSCFWDDLNPSLKDEFLQLIWYLLYKHTPSTYEFSHLNTSLKNTIKKASLSPIKCFKIDENQNVFELNLPVETAQFQPYIAWKNKEKACFENVKNLIIKEEQWNAYDFDFIKENENWLKSQYWFSVRKLNYVKFYKRNQHERKRFELEEKTKVKKQLLIKRRRRTVAFLGSLGALSILSFYLFSLQQNEWIKEANKQAHFALKKAQVNEEKAMLNEKRALAERDKTNKALLEAKKAKKEAVFQSELAQLSEKKALAEKREAIQQKERATSAEEEAFLAKNKMENQALLEWSKSLALQSLNASSWNEMLLKTLAAYNIQTKIAGPYFNTHLYKAFYQTLLKKKGKNFNQIQLQHNGSCLWEFNNGVFVLNQNGTLHFWQNFHQQKNKLKSFQLPPLGIYKNAYLVPNTSKVLAYGAFGYTVIFDLSSFQSERFSLENNIYDVIIPLNEKYWIGGNLNEVKILEQGKIKKSLRIEGHIIDLVQFQNKNYLISSRGVLYEIVNFDIKKVLQLDFSPKKVIKWNEEEMLLGDAKGNLFHFDIHNRKALKSWKAHDSRITQIKKIGADEFVTSSLDHSWKIWNIKSRSEVIGIQDVGDWIVDLIYLKESKELIALDKNRTLSYWPLLTQDWLKEIQFFQEEYKLDDQELIKQLFGDDYQKIKPFL